MVHLAPSTRSRRRLDVIIGGLLAVVGIGVAVLAIVALHQPKGHQAAKAATTPSTTPVSSALPSSAPPSSSRPTSTPTSKSTSTSGTAVGASLSAKSVPLVVLNSTNQSGLAASAAKTFASGGWTVTSSGNIVNNIASTCAYYDPSDPKNEAAAAALMAQYPSIKRIKEKFAELPAGPVVVVLTSDYS